MMLNEQTMTVKAAMVQASISSPRGALYFSGEATPYNLEHLRTYVRALRDGAGESTCVSLNLGAGSDAVVVAEIERLARELARKGIQVHFSAADLIFTPKSPPDRASRSATTSTVQTGSR